MATTKLGLYNGALLICKERPLASLTENRPARYLLDQEWNDPGYAAVLEQGQWKFARRTAQLIPDVNVTPAFGYANSFTKPTDWVLTCAVCWDEFFTAPLLQYSDEAGALYADATDLFVKFVSSDGNYGGNLGRWPFAFTEYVKTFFASRIVGQVSQDKELIDKIMAPRTGLLDQARLQALNVDAIADPTHFPARGNWVRARWGRTNGTSWNDGGNRSALIG